MFKSIFAAISALFTIVETSSRAINRLATTADYYAAQIEAEAKLEAAPTIAAAKSKFASLGLTEHDLLGTKAPVSDSAE